MSFEADNEVLALPQVAIGSSGAAAESFEPLPIVEAADVEAHPGSLHRAVWTLAWPSVVTMLMQTVNGLMDTFFVGHLPDSQDALAATGVGGQFVFLLISLAMGVSVGTTALVARFAGAADRRSAAHAAGQSVSLALVMGAVFCVLAYSTRDLVIGLMLGDERGPARLCSQFLSAALLATVPLFVTNVLIAVFRGLGNTRTPLLVQCAVIATHISFNALLIYGLAGFPRMGVRGAGTAFALSLFVGAALYTAALLRLTPLADALTRKHLALRMEWVVRILRIGIPASIQAVVRNLASMSFASLLARSVDGAAGVAALQIGMRAEAIAFMPGFGYSVAAAALVGQSLGARSPRRAEASGWAALLQAIALMTFMACVFYTFAMPLARLFTSDTTVQRLAADYLRVNAYCEPFVAMGMVLTGALQGAGDTMRPTYITFGTMWIMRLPLAWWLMFACHLNSHGAWISMTVSTITGGLLTLALFKSGKWKRIKV